MKATEHKETGEKMHVYEVSYLIVPTVAEDKVADEVAALKAILEKSKAEIIAEGAPELIDLAYTMEKATETKKNKFNEAYFGWMKFELPVASISDIKKSIETRANILRHLIIKTVRENTMYAGNIPGLGKKGEPMEGDAPADATKSENPASQKEIDKSIDALVIS